MHIFRRKLTDRSLKLICSLISVALLVIVAPRIFAAHGKLDSRIDLMSTSVASAVATHSVGFTVNNLAQPIGSVTIEFCSNSPILGDVCTFPSGFDASIVNLASQQGEIGFSIDGNSTASKIILTRPAVLPTGSPATYELANIINPDTAGSYYLRLQTFTSTDGTGTHIEEGGIAIAIHSPLTVTAEVPPYLKFCTSVTIVTFDCSSATSYLIDFGELRTSQANAASSEFVVATNASSGYSVTLTGTTLTSGNNTVSPLTSGGVSLPGTSQFGLNLRANSNPGVGGDPIGPGMGTVSASYGIPNVFRFQNGDTLATSAGSSDNNKFTVSYMINVSLAQPAGFYATTITYICLANF